MVKNNINFFINYIDLFITIILYNLKTFLNIVTKPVGVIHSNGASAPCFTKENFFKSYYQGEMLDVHQPCHWAAIQYS